MLQLCPTLCIPVDCSQPGSSVHGILQARVVERVAISSSRASSLTQGSNLCFLPCQVDSLPLCHLGSPLQRSSPNAGGYLSMTSDLIHPVSSSWVQTQDWLWGCQDFARVSLDSFFLWIVSIPKVWYGSRSRNFGITKTLVWISPLTSCVTLGKIKVQVPYLKNGNLQPTKI